MAVKLAESEESGAKNGSDEYYWDAVAKTAMGRYVTPIETAFIEDALSQLEGKLELAIDAGAGSGRFTRLLAEQADQVIATEAKPELIDVLSKVAPNVTPKLVRPDESPLPFDDNSVDAVVSIEAGDLSQAPEFHRDCARVLRPGGVVVLTLQNRSSWKGLLGRVRRTHYQAEHGATYYSWSLADLKRSLTEAGLVVSDVAGFNWLPFPRASDSGLIGPLSRLENALGLRKLASLSPWVLVSAKRP